MCTQRGEEVHQWDKELRAWQAAFNKEILGPKGLFMKTQSYCYVTHGQNGEKHRHINRWLSFALTPGHISAEEPTVFGEI